MYFEILSPQASVLVLGAFLIVFVILRIFVW